MRVPFSFWRPSSGVPAPVLTSTNYDVFDNAGGDSITLTGTDLDSAISVTIDPGGSEEATLTITGNTSTTVTVTTPAIAADTYDIVVETAHGTSNAVSIKAWAPSSISGGLHAWIADRGVTLTSGKVSQWADQIGAMHQNQANASLQPTVTTSANYGGKAILAMASSSFNGVVGSAMVAPITVLIVGHMTSGLRSIVSGGANLFWRRSDNGAIEFYTNAPSTVRTAGSASSGASAGAFLFTDDGSASAIYRNDFATPQGTQTSHWQSTTALNVGLQLAGGFTAGSGELAEIIVVDGIISSGDLDDYAIRTALRYGLPVTA